MFIYKITDKTNGKIYIGQTTRTIEIRFEEHKKADSYIGNAIRKHGIENFTIEIVEVCQSVEELNERERYWIAELQSKPPNGYNLTDGGDCPWRGKGLGKNWIVVCQEAALWLAQQGLTGEQLNVMLYLFGKLDFDNYIRVSRKDISDWTHVHPVNVSKAMKELKDRDIIAEGPRAGLNKTYRLNPYIAYKGKERNQTIVDFQNLKKTSKRRNTSN